MVVVKYSFRKSFRSFQENLHIRGYKTQFFVIFSKLTLSENYYNFFLFIQQQMTISEC